MSLSRNKQKHSTLFLFGEFGVTQQKMQEYIERNIIPQCAPSTKIHVEFGKSTSVDTYTPDEKDGKIRDENGNTAGKSIFRFQLGNNSKKEVENAIENPAEYIKITTQRLR